MLVPLTIYQGQNIATFSATAFCKLMNVKVQVPPRFPEQLRMVREAVFLAQPGCQPIRIENVH